MKKTAAMQLIHPVEYIYCYLIELRQLLHPADIARQATPITKLHYDIGIPLHLPIVDAPDKIRRVDTRDLELPLKPLYDDLPLLDIGHFPKLQQLQGINAAAGVLHPVHRPKRPLTQKASDQILIDGGTYFGQETSRGFVFTEIRHQKRV